MKKRIGVLFCALLADVPTALTIPANTTTTLNLNGFTLGAADGTAPLTVAEGGALTITDTSENKTGKIAYTGSDAVSAIENHGRLTIETANVSTAALISNSGETLTVVGQAAVTEGGAAYYPIDVVCGIDTLNYTTVGIEYRVIRITPYAIGMDGTEYRGRTIELDGDVCADNGTVLFAKGE